MFRARRRSGQKRPVFVSMLFVFGRLVLAAVLVLMFVFVLLLVFLLLLGLEQRF